MLCAGESNRMLVDEGGATNAKTTPRVFWKKNGGAYCSGIGFCYSCGVDGVSSKCF